MWVKTENVEQHLLICLEEEQHFLQELMIYNFLLYS